MTSARHVRRPAVLVLALGCWLGAGAASGVGGARALPPIVTSHHGSFAPKVGDWEGSLAGFPASFQLVYEPEYAAFGRPPYGYEDLTTLEPSSCPLSPSQYAVGVIGNEDITPLGAGGLFPLADEGFGGGFTGAESATLTSGFDTGAAAAGCAGTLSRPMRPATRRTVQDGPWTLRFSDHESESFQVSAGGRAATGIDFPPALGGCGGPRGNLNLFINARGVAADVGPHRAFAVKLTFTSSRRAKGRITAPGSGCPALRMAASVSG